MPQRLQNDLSKRERQVMEIIYLKKEASARDILNELPKPPSYSAVRSILYIQKKGGLLECKKEGKKNIYVPTISPKKAMNSALRSLLKTHFDNSIEKAVTAILEAEDKYISNEELDRLAKLIDDVKYRGDRKNG